MAHTPGPWQVGRLIDNDARVIETEDHGPIIGTAWMMGDDFNNDTAAPEREANARLIATAPELLDVCEQASHWITATFAVPPPGLMKSLTAVITKAKEQ